MPGIPLVELTNNDKEETRIAFSVVDIVAITEAFDPPGVTWYDGYIKPMTRIYLRGVDNPWNVMEQYSKVIERFENAATCL